MHTSVRVVGYKKTEFVDEVPSDRIINIQDLQVFQRLSPERNWFDTINALAANAEHTPAYYAIARLAMQIFGSSVTVTRGVAAVISLFVFPCVYWLCLELFAAPLVGWIAMALVAVSPIHVLYAQEARQYSLLTVTTLLASIAFLRAIRQKTKLSWGMYALTVVLGLYSHLLFILVSFAHGVYLLLLEQFRVTKNFLAYLIASLVAIATLIPWIILYFINASSIGEWTARAISFEALIQRWLLNFTALFFDMQVAYNNAQFFDVEAGNDIQFNANDVLLYVIPLFIALVVYAFYILCSRTSISSWLFVVTLLIIPTISLVLPDLISGGQRSSIARYLLPGYVAIQIAVAYLFANRLTASLKYSQQKVWQIILAIALASGTISCIVSAQAETWWNKYSSYYNPEIANIINQANQPLAISSQRRVSRITSLSYELEPNVSVLLVSETEIPEDVKRFREIFLFRPDAELQARLQNDPEYKLELLHAPGQLWRVQIDEAQLSN
ncbi:glycosyltransferase family 39 protein [Chroococcidiopsis sp. TS-821]|uniref:glycosyltransferase family 39 protein n=1 Tax=Chroococcidiopsis sp. TS-821 TaxID=1378066 RepID=UPI001AEF73B2|nr:glycosyltransferase family 39 protein [Chroococcidiopsis sp. TS-821]